MRSYRFEVSGQSPRGEGWDGFKVKIFGLSWQRSSPASIELVLGGMSTRSQEENLVLSLSMARKMLSFIGINSWGAVKRELLAEVSTFRLLFC